MISRRAQNPAAVDKLHVKAIALGATDEGHSGPRLGGAFHIDYFRDLDGKKLKISA